mmetsp:Transcript_11643/g.27914  ORF Transcript_11643/g.27914 Transcript_11643/m.27914 type:complete len:283 (+) Transcript_11643:273-1121(+)
MPEPLPRRLKMTSWFAPKRSSLATSALRAPRERFDRRQMQQSTWRSCLSVVATNNGSGATTSAASVWRVRRGSWMLWAPSWVRQWKPAMTLTLISVTSEGRTPPLTQIITGALVPVKLLPRLATHPRLVCTLPPLWDLTVRRRCRLTRRRPHKTLRWNLPMHSRAATLLWKSQRISVLRNHWDSPGPSSCLVPRLPELVEVVPTLAQSARRTFSWPWQHLRASVRLGQLSMTNVCHFGNAAATIAIKKTLSATANQRSGSWFGQTTGRSKESAGGIQVPCRS